ncbi:TBC1 domain family member 31-like [Anopheles coustani]|uniref:TBC1 domain family member 31-like n=1 Tax=Anopheles coustani TaxID=139045 RepID=UPI002659156C|nr:TBC1 domain family member 31-like [Anopheles coustani]
MAVNISSVVKHGKAGFKFSSACDDILLNIHHTVDNNSDGIILRIRFTAAGFSANNERLIAVDHRENVFVFDLIGQKYWLLLEKLKKITVIEGLSGGNLVACANKEGMVYVVDIDEKQPTVKIKALPASVLGLTQSPDPVPFNPHLKPQKCDNMTNSRYLLVNGQQCAKVYQADGFTEVSSLNYGFTSHSAVQLKEWHWFSGPNGPSLISYSASGIIKAYRINFTLIKELNVTRLIGLYLKNTSAQMIEFEPTVNAAGGDVSAARVSDADKMGRVIKRITEDSPNGFIKAAQVSADGRYYALLCSNNSLAFLALESWLVCRVVAFSNLFITRYAFLPIASSSTTGSLQRPYPLVSIALVAQTVDNDLVLLNFGQCNRKHPPTLFPLAMRNRALRSGKSKCYKFCPAPNGRMLANVLTSGEVLLHNLDAYLQSNTASPAVSVGILPGTGKLAPGVTGRSHPNYYGKNLLIGSATSSSSSVTLSGTGGGNRQKVKIERQMDAIHSEIAKTLPKERLLPIVKEYGEYPAKHRPTIWRTLLELPSDAESFGALLQRGHHPCVASLDERRFPSQDSRTVRNVKKIVSCLAHWCPVFGLIDYLPYFVFPFVRQHPNDALVAFETVATVLLNQCQLWFEFAPLEPWNYLAMVENVLAEFEPRLMSFYRSHSIASRAYTLPLMETAFSRCFLADRWACLWDHVLSNEPYFPVFLIAAYNAVHRGALMGTCSGTGTGTPSMNEESITNFFHQSSSVDVRRVVRRAYDLMERCPDAIHPRNYFKSFVPLSAPYPCAAMQRETLIDSGTSGRTVYHSAGNNAIDFTRPRRETPSSEGGTSMDVYWPSSSATEGYVNFCNFPKTLTDVRCTETNALQAEHRRLEVKIIELEKLEHSLKDRMVNNLIRQEHEQRVKKVEQNFEEAISREEERIEMQRKLLLLHRKQLRERESELSFDLHNANLINDATVRERELEGLLKKLQRERQREETDLLFAEEDIKLKELELLARYRSETVPPPALGSATSDGYRRSDHPRYQQALEQLAVQKQKLYDEIDRTYSSLGMPTGSNEYTYRTVTELRKVASVASNERYPSKVRNHPVKLQQTAESRPIHAVTSQVKLYKDAIQHMEEQVKVLQRLKNDSVRTK